ncbi:M20/M25/M40 family metallo-hydrolase [Myxococcus sp. Y35]|uniref:M20/M25/M40 family metallo-hydrolase n=1 Tax=Pseudomyxococcus flavus TaxID=3115648 RepID=UPI003CF664A1
MNMKRLASVLLVLWSASAFAKAPPARTPLVKAPDRVVWITLGSDALEHVNAALKGAGHEAAVLSGQKDEVTALRVRESQLNLISRMMHEKLNRCGGFIYHDTEAAALAALDVSAARKAVPATAVTYSIDNAETVNALVKELQEFRIRDTIDHLSSYATRYYSSETGVSAAHSLKQRWEALVPAERTDITVEHFAHSWAQPSVILTIPGSSLKEEVVVLGGHLDSTSSGRTAPGADDDASGIATLTEVIRVALLRGYRPARTVKFMAYAAEEVGLRGSTAIANDYRSKGVDVVGVLQLDMTNYKGSASHDVALVSDRTSAAQNTFITSLIGTYFNDEIKWTTTWCGYACSDHASWTSAGFVASMPFEAPLSESNPHIHTANDTLQNSGGDARHSVKFAKIATAYLVELAKGFLDDGKAPQVAITSPAAGSMVSGVTTVTASASDASGVNRVEFLVDGVVKATVATAPYTFAWNTAAEPNGSHRLEARAHDGGGQSALSPGVSVTVRNVPSVAGFDPVLRAPRCFSESHACESGTLLNGRGGMGPEANAPNTINNSCADGVAGTYLREQSNEHIQVYTLDGAHFTAGKQVQVDATVWVFNPRSDRLDLFYAANANAPEWQLIGTLSAPSRGRHVLSATYELPAGTGAQAVRAVFRLSGSANPCNPASYTDHDDLIFTVGRDPTTY